MSLPGQRTSWDWNATSIGGIPVTFSAWYLLTVWFVLARAASFETGAVHLVAVTLSVLIHELGHGFAARRYRLQPRIVLHGFGGFCEHAPAHYRDQDLAVVAAGPGAGLAIGVIAYGLAHGLRAPPWWLGLLLHDLAWMGLFWSAVNLLPIRPLDGGSIFENLLGRTRRIAVPGRTAAQVSVAVALVAMIAAGWHGQLWLAILMAVLAWDNAVALGAVPAIPGLSFGVAPAATAVRGSKVVRYPWWRMTPGARNLLVVLAIPVVLNAFVNLPTAFAGLAVRADAVGQPWRMLTWPAVPVGNVLGQASALLAIGLFAPTVERVTGSRGLIALIATATVGAGVAAVLASPLGSVEAVFGGPVALAIAVAAAWAWFSRDLTLGPNAIRAMRPPVVLAGVLIVDLAGRVSSRDAMGAAADASAALIGLAFAILPRGPDSLWARLKMWWYLRNPPKVAIDFRPRR